jgi:predicted porin
MKSQVGSVTFGRAAGIARLVDGAFTAPARGGLQLEMHLSETADNILWQRTSALASGWREAAPPSM